MKAIKKIDIHAHAIMFHEQAPKDYVTGERFCSASEVIELYDKLEIEKGVLMPLLSPEANYDPMTSKECAFLASQNPDRFFWFCNIDPRSCGHSPSADLSKYIEHYKMLGAKGLGEITANIPIDDPLIDNLFFHCEENDMPVTIHLAPMNAKYGFYGLKDEIGLPRLEKMLKKHRKLKVFGHSQLFWAEISTNVTEENRIGCPGGKVNEGRIAYLLRKYPNLYCDCSAGSGTNALMRDKEYTAKFIEEFSDRLMYGCDICYKSNKRPFVFKEWLDGFRKDGYINEDNYHKFVRGNAIRLLKLENLSK